MVSWDSERVLWLSEFHASVFIIRLSVPLVPEKALGAHGRYSGLAFNIHSYFPVVGIPALQSLER